MRAALVCAFALAMTALSGPSVRAEGEAEDLGKTLAAAVDLPTREQRLSAAATLAARQDVTIEAWLGAMRGFGHFARMPAGPRTETAVLRVGDAEEKTEIAVHLPPGYAPGKPAPLLLALHGAGGEGHDEQELWRAAADEIGMIVVAPTDKTADLGLEYGDASRNRVLAALRWARRTYDVDENRVFLAGVSRGGHLAWDVALRHPEHFAALVPIIGATRLNPANNANNIRYLENVAHLPIRDLQGAGDNADLIKNLKLSFKRLKDFGARDAELLLQPDLGHDFDPHAVDWAKFLGSASRQAVPLRVVRACATIDEARAGWAEVVKLWPTVDEKVVVLFTERQAKDLDDEGKRLFAQSEIDKKTARLEVKFDGPGRFTATLSLVQRFRILLAEEMFDPASPVEITINGKLTKKSVTRSKLVLLREFVERFDRTFLPVAEAVVP